MTFFRRAAWVALVLMILPVAPAVTPADAQTAPAGWLREWPDTDFGKTSVGFDEILSGGPPRDGIPAIDRPAFARADRLNAAPRPNEPVMSLDIGGDARAYPLSVMIWHEIVNDTVGGLPVAVTFCPLCNSGIVFDRRVEGQATTFGTTGKLRNSDLVMYDRASESWWQQYNGTAIVGARLGTKLDRVPVRLESYAEFVARHPSGLVLVPDGSTARAYGRNPYVGYDSLRRPFLYDGTYDGPGSPMMRVLAVAGRNEAWSLDYIRAKSPVRAGDLEIRWTAGQASALDAGRIAEGRDVGTVTVERIGADGSRRLVVYDLPFAFAFNAFNPGAPIRHD